MQDIFHVLILGTLSFWSLYLACKLPDKDEE